MQQSIDFSHSDSDTFHLSHFSTCLLCRLLSGDLPFRLLLQIIGAEFIIYNNSSRYKRLSDIMKHKQNKANQVRLSAADLSEITGELSTIATVAIDADDQGDDENQEDEKVVEPASPSSRRDSNSRRSARSRRQAAEAAESPGVCARALTVLTCSWYKIESAVERSSRLKRSREQQPQLSEEEAAERFQVDLPWFYRYRDLALKNFKRIS